MLRKALWRRVLSCCLGHEHPASAPFLVISGRISLLSVSSCPCHCAVQISERNPYSRKKKSAHVVLESFAEKGGVTCVLSWISQGLRSAFSLPLTHKLQVPFSLHIQCHFFFSSWHFPHSCDFTVTESGLLKHCVCKRRTVRRGVAGKLRSGLNSRTVSASVWFQCWCVGSAHLY